MPIRRSRATCRRCATVEVSFLVALLLATPLILSIELYKLIVLLSITLGALSSVVSLLVTFLLVVPTTLLPIDWDLSIGNAANVLLSDCCRRPWAAEML